MYVDKLLLVVVGGKVHNGKFMKMSIAEWIPHQLPRVHAFSLAMMQVWKQCLEAPSLLHFWLGTQADPGGRH